MQPMNPHRKRLGQAIRKLAEKLGLEAKILSGKDLASLRAAVEGKQFRGTLIRP